MRKLLVLLPILATLFAAPLAIEHIVLAQDSPFGGLTTEPVSLRRHESVDGITLAEYTATRSNYDDLQSLYERAFGARKVELEEQILARAKDIQIAKMGATLTYLNNLKADLEVSGRASSESVGTLDSAISGYSVLLSPYQEQVEAAESVAAVEAVSTQINESIVATLDQVIPHLAILSVARGEALITLVEEKSEVIQEHIRASAALGGDTAGPQELFEDSMLALEDARDDYEVLNGLVGDGSSVDTSRNALNNLENLLASSTEDMKKNSDGLNEVLDQLRALYGQSPWMIDTAKFKNAGLEELEEDISEGTESAEVTEGDAMEKEPAEGEAMEETN